MSIYCCGVCGSEVTLNSNSCPSCSAIFGKIRCSKCNYVGAAQHFSDACPSCGYQPQQGASIDINPSEQSDLASKAKQETPSKKKSSSSSPLSTEPFLFVTTALALLVALAMLATYFLGDF